MNILMDLIFLPALSFFLLLLLTKYATKTSSNRLPPGPKGLPFIGNLHQLGNSNIQLFLWQLSKKYGPLMSLKLGFRQALVVSSAEMAREVLKVHDLEFCSRPSLVGQQKLSYNGLDLAFSPYGSYWREIRKICVVHLFNSNLSIQFRPIREFEVSDLISKISESASSSEPFNLADAMMSLTNTVISRVALGERYQDGGVEERRFTNLLEETQVMLGSFFLSDHFPYLGWLDKLSGMQYRLQRNFDKLDAFFQEIIDEHLDPKRQKPEHENILDVLLNICQDRSIKFQMTFDHVKAILMNVLVAGTETSAAAVIWAMSFLMKNPSAMKKAQEEVRNFVGSKGFVNEDDIESLTYLKAVVKETMRLQPAAPLLVPRETTQDCNIGGYEIPSKTLVYVNAWAIGRDTKAWNDPHKFSPERFLGSPIDLKGNHYELIPFGGGRRICPGIYLGLATLELSLANILYRFDWEMPEGMKREDIDTENGLPGITVHMKHPVHFVPKHSNLMEE